MNDNFKLPLLSSFTSQARLLGDCDPDSIYNEPYEPPADTVTALYSQLSGLLYRHVARHQIKVGKKLGNG